MALETLEIRVEERKARDGCWRTGDSQAVAAGTKVIVDVIRSIPRSLLSFVNISAKSLIVVFVDRKTLDGESEGGGGIAGKGAAHRGGETDVDGRGMNAAGDGGRHPEVDREIVVKSRCRASAG